jgi:DNA gyrase inhibitor GyrI
MHFYMPDGYSVSSLPRPNNDEVKLEELESKRVAVIQFGGWANQSKIDRYQAKLIQLLKEDGVAHTDNFYFLGYNAPYEVTNRRNEVIVELE